LEAALASGLKNLHRTIGKIQTADVSGKEEKLKVIWVFGRYATSGRRTHGALRMSLDRFKQFAFGISKAQRVFNQLSDFGIEAGFEGLEPNEQEEPRVTLAFRDDGETNMALRHYVKELLERHDEYDGLDLFKRADMSVLSAAE
jgi:hypothetical protein